MLQRGLPTGEPALVPMMKMHSGGMDLLTMEGGLTREIRNGKRDIEAAGPAWKKGLEVPGDPADGPVILGERNVVFRSASPPVETVTRAPAEKQSSLHAAATGRSAPPELSDLAGPAPGGTVIQPPVPRDLPAQEALEF